MKFRSHLRAPAERHLGRTLGEHTRWVVQMLCSSLPGGILRVEQSRETLRPVRIAHGGDDRSPRVTLAAGKRLYNLHFRKATLSGFPISILGDP